MAYTPKTIHSGEQSGGYSTKNAQDLATVLEAIDTAIGAAGDVSPAPAIVVTALTGTLTGTNDGALNDITYNATWSSAQANEINANFKEIQSKISTIVSDLGALRTAINAVITTLA